MDDVKRGRNRFRDITMRESNYGLDLLGSIVSRQLKAVDFSTFKTSDALEVIKADIMEEIRQANHGCSTASARTSPRTSIRLNTLLRSLQ